MPNNAIPLAEQMRPKTIDDMVGQESLIGDDGIIRHMLYSGRLRSCIFYGPPGCGKSCVAKLMATQANMPYAYLNATTATTAELKKAIGGKPSQDEPTLIYLDEIQYFNKKQQQTLLSFVEDGSIVLVAATTENPYHDVYKALLSRCLVLEFKPLSTKDILTRLVQVCKQTEPAIAVGEQGISKDALIAIARAGAGDMRRALNLLDVLDSTFVLRGNSPADTVDAKTLDALMPDNIMGSFDKDGDQHYRYKAALQKSIRGSDPDAAVFWLMQMLEGGDIISPARRMLVMASEDVGLADPLAVTVVLSCIQAAERVGLPEACYPLAQAAIYLATAPKSNSIGCAFNAARKDIHAGLGTIVPTHIASEHPRDYIYPHNFPNHWVDQQYLPDDLITRQYWVPQENKSEQARAAYWTKIRKITRQRS